MTSSVWTVCGCTLDVVVLPVLLSVLRHPRDARRTRVVLVYCTSTFVLTDLFGGCMLAATRIAPALHTHQHHFLIS
jgi:hypothetical protein